MRYFITGTDTDVGKTFVSACLCSFFAQQGLKTAYFKPIQSGALTGGNEASPPANETDAGFVKKISPKTDVYNTYLTQIPCAPLVSAKIDGVAFDFETIKTTQRKIERDYDVVITEGAGGLLVPLTEKLLVADLIKFLDLPAIIVARALLGTVNHTLLTIEALKSRNILLAGVVLNGITDKEEISQKNAADMIQKFSNSKILAQIPKMDSCADFGNLFSSDLCINL